jgi:RNA polymerase-binding transcription factor DksA
MTNEDLEKFEKRLIAEEAKTEADLKATPDVVNFGDSQDEDTEEADESTAADLQASKKDILFQKLDNVRSALNKIKNHIYGKCEIGGEDIETEILELNPSARYCREHNKQEL